MNDTRFDSRSSEWVGDMTVWSRSHSADNSEQLERLRKNLRRARERELTARQREMLEQEGVGFLPDGRADMKGFLWHPDTVSALQGQD